MFKTFNEILDWFQSFQPFQLFQSFKMSQNNSIGLDRILAPACRSA
jgi:hypothetical protein